MIIPDIKLYIIIPAAATKLACIFCRKELDSVLSQCIHVLLGITPLMQGPQNSGDRVGYSIACISLCTLFANFVAFYSICLSLALILIQKLKAV